jgi:hypothetical protein
MISVDYTTHPGLYEDYRKAIEFCSQIPNTKQIRKTHFHVQWIGSDIGRMQLMPIKAFVTSQDLEFCHLTVWTDRPYTGEQFPNVEFKVFDPFTEIQGTSFQGKRLYYFNTDIMRMVYLSKYGGVHIDMDTVLLRDLSPLLDQEFFYTWGIKHEEIAGGVINLFKNSPVTLRICEEIIKGEQGLYKELFSYVRQFHDFSVFPCAWFNTEWAIGPEQYIDNDHFQFIRSPVKKNKYAAEFYEGVFSWHWHNCWTEAIEEGSKWQLMEEFINQKYKEKYG